MDTVNGTVQRKNSRSCPRRVHMDASTTAHAVRKKLEQGFGSTKTTSTPLIQEIGIVCCNKRFGQNLPPPLLVLCHRRLLVLAVAAAHCDRSIAQKRSSRPRSLCFLPTRFARVASLFALSSTYLPTNNDHPPTTTAAVAVSHVFVVAGVVESYFCHSLVRPDPTIEPVPVGTGPNAFCRR
jgi:hypothetical protein